MAGTILTSTSDSIKSVAAQTGFRDSTYFCRVFRSVVGLTPREYRAQAQGRG
jgi:AraC-like DNA-binding protein